MSNFSIAASRPRQALKHQFAVIETRVIFERPNPLAKGETLSPKPQYIQHLKVWELTS